MSVAVVWGWNGVGGAVAMVVLGLLALVVAYANLEDASAGQPFLTRLMGSGRAALTLLFAVLLFGGAAVSFVGAFREQRIQFTVRALRKEVSGRHPRTSSYEVDDTEGRTFVADHDDWKKLREGDHIECRVVAVPMLPDRLLSCSQQPR